MTYATFVSPRQETAFIGWKDMNEKINSPSHQFVNVLIIQPLTEGPRYYLGTTLNQQGITRAFRRLQALDYQPLNQIMTQVKYHDTGEVSFLKLSLYVQCMYNVCTIQE